MSDSVRESTESAAVRTGGNSGAYPATGRVAFALVAGRGSDLLLVAGVPASIRFEGRVQPIGSEKLSGAEIEAAVLPALIPRAVRQYEEGQISDSSYRLAGVGRFRVNLHREKGMAAATYALCRCGFRCSRNFACRLR